jgi:aryl-alcohol dehydrogenase-like predicted oxidoreductase
MPRTPTSVEEIAKKRGASMAQISLAWVLTKEGSCTPIRVGPREEMH